MRHKSSAAQPTSAVVPAVVARATLLAAVLAVSAAFGLDNHRYGLNARHQIPLAASAANDVPLREQLELPRGKAATGAFRFVALGDAGTGGKQQYEVAHRMNVFHDERPFGLVLFLGDNIYPNGAPADFERKFTRPYAQLVRRQVELRGCLGNHDVRDARGALMQMRLFGMISRPYHSFTKEGDLIEFFALDSTRLGKRAREDGNDDEQLRWLDTALARSVARWKLVFLHHPLYSSGKRHGHGSRDERRMLQLRADLEPILIKHKVSVVLSGHDHI
ncbi:MAG TPA: metallophosphoesterase, partial [Pyrinomonadaceae bacterium]|nr:metallophosphoesterase [Pyrinomonadaceae bacterium]